MNKILSFKNIQAVLFDMDGTIIDTTEFIYQAFEYTLKTHGHSAVSREDLAKLMGLPLTDTYQRITLLKEVQHLFTTHDQFQRRNLQLAAPFPHAIATIKTLRKHGIKTAVVTTRGKASTMLTLEKQQMVWLFDAIITFEDVSAPKPDPEPVLKALQLLEVNPAQAMMVGDTDLDILAGHNAGVKTVGVTYGFQGEKIKEAHPDHVIDSIEELVPIIIK